MNNNSNIKNLISIIKDRWDCLSYASSVLNLPVHKDGDRCVSFRPDAHNPSSFVCYKNHWIDFGSGKRGDVIDLCAEAKYNGNLSDAIKDLAGDLYSPLSSYSWKNYMLNLNNKINAWHSALRPQDFEYLHSRRINNETINRLHIGYSSQYDRIIIPYWKNGQFVYYAGRDRSGKKDAPKYKKAFLDGFNQNVPWGLHTLSNDFALDKPDFLISSDGIYVKRSDFLIIAEGMFDAISFEQEGFHVLSPISGYFSKDLQNIVIPAMKNHKTTFILFDSDKAGISFQQKMAEICFSHRINFLCGELPQGVKDVSDFYAAGGNLADLIAHAHNGIATLAKSFKDKNNFSAFIRKAARFVKRSDIIDFCSNVTAFNQNWLKAVILECTGTPSEVFIVDEVSKDKNLKFIEKSGFFEYHHGVWSLQSDNIIKSYIADALGLFANGNKLASILSFLKARLSSQEVFNSQHIFNFLNGVLNLNTGELLDHSPAFMSTVQANFYYDKSAKCPLWDKFIDDIMMGDQTKKLLLQQIAGYILFPDCSLEKAFILMGNGSNGKSVFLNVLAEVFGKDHCSNVDISDLMSPFEPIRLQNSIVNFSTETKSDIKNANDKFKKVISGEKISAAFKGHDAIEFRPRAKWFCASNNFITANDISYGTTRRLIFINFNRTFKGSEVDKELTQKLIAEKSGIFNWIFEGYKMLQISKEFHISDEQHQLEKEFLENISPTSAFFEEKLDTIENVTKSTKQLYSEYVDWCKETGCKPSNRLNFTRNIRQIFTQRRPDVIFKHTNEGNAFVFNLPKITGGINL